MTLTKSLGAPLNFISEDGQLGVICAGFTLHATVTSAAALSVSAGTFAGCMGTGSLCISCTTTLPMTITGSLADRQETLALS